ncbi:MAG: hypothetical protein NC489_08865 [Ruminococcus flavefaciens]|nr:hypothetical protein [Ruminococcus flavefaciens]
MGKKSRKAKQKKYYGYDLSNRSSKKDKKKKGSKTVGYKAPKLGNMKPTLDKKEAKTNRKIVTSPVDVPKEFLKNRLKCNHAGAQMSVADFKTMTPSWSAYTPATERMVTKFGADKVCICKQCYDVLVARECIDTDKVNEALTVLYAACNVAIGNKRMKDDEVKKIAKLKEVIADFQPVIDTLERIAEDEREYAKNNGTGNGNLNNTPGGAFIG